MFWFQQGKALPQWTQCNLSAKGCSEGGKVTLVCGCAAGELGDLERFRYFSTSQLGKWH